MATARGHHRDEDLRPPGGDRPLRHPARADPRLLRAEGRHLRQHPRHPRDRRQDRQRADPVASARSRTCSRTSTRSKAPSANRTSIEHAEDARVSKQLATVQRDLEVDLDIAARGRARARPRRACARSSASTSCATRCGAWRRRSATPTWRRRPSAAEVTLTARLRSGLAGGHRAARRGAAASSAWSSRASEAPEGELFAEGPAWRFASPRGRRGARRASAPVPRRSSRPARARPVVAHDAKALRHGARRARPRHAARRLPARARAARLPVRRAVRGARPRERPRGPARRARR